MAPPPCPHSGPPNTIHPACCHHISLMPSSCLHLQLSTCCQGKQGLCCQRVRFRKPQDWPSVPVVTAAVVLPGLVLKVISDWAPTKIPLCCTDCFVFTNIRVTLWFYHQFRVELNRAERLWTQLQPASPCLIFSCVCSFRLKVDLF